MPEVAIEQVDVGVVELVIMILLIEMECFLFAASPPLFPPSFPPQSTALPPLRQLRCSIGSLRASDSSETTGCELQPESVIALLITP